MHLLSKSKYIRGLQCERALWLDVFRPSLARYSREQMRRFDAGRTFEYAVKARFRGGVDVSAVLGRRVDDYPAYTAQLLESEEPVVLFEAGFQWDDVLVLADVVRKTPEGGVEVFEVKSGTSLSDTYRRDAALQCYVISHCQQVQRFSVIHRTDTTDALFTSDDFYTTVDLTAQLMSEAPTVASHIAAMKEVLSHGEPDTPTGQHCTTPYDCPYQHYCKLGVRQTSLF